MATAVALCCSARLPDGVAQVPVSSAPVAAPLGVWLDAGGVELDRERLRRTLARELKREVVLTEAQSDAAIQIRLESPARAQVDYTAPSGERSSRAVDLPPDRQRSLEVLSWVSVNLVRDEASELLQELRARRKAEAEARAAQLKAAEDKAAADKAAADKAAADKAAADRAAADKAAADKAAAAAKRKIDLTVEPAPNAGLLRDPKKSFDVAFISPASVIRDSTKRELHMQLALLYGDSGGVRGFAASMFALRMRRDLLGHAVALGAVFVGGNARGTIGSVGYSQVDGKLEGAQVSVGMALHRGKFARGVVMSAGVAVAGDVTGVVLGTGVASARSLEGCAISAGLTVLRGPAEGALLGAGATFASDVVGTQLSAGLNVGRDLTGVAVAPVNVQRKVRGVQFGVVNVAEQVDGAAIGIISLAKNGRLQPVLWSDTAGALHVAIKSIAGYAFTQLGGGIDVNTSELGYDGGVGAHFRLSEKIFLEPGVHYSGRQSVGTAEASQGLTRHDFHYLVGAGLRLGNKVDLLAAGGLRHSFAGADAGTFGASGRVGLAFF